MKKIFYFIAEDHSLTSIGIKQIFSDFEMGGAIRFCAAEARLQNMKRLKNSMRFQIRAFFPTF